MRCLPERLKMTPKAELRAARKALGMTQHGLAEALGMGTHGWQSISRWESDNNETRPPGPVMVALRLMMEKR